MNMMNTLINMKKAKALNVRMEISNSMLFSYNMRENYKHEGIVFL